MISLILNDEQRQLALEVVDVLKRITRYATFPKSRFTYAQDQISRIERLLDGEVCEMYRGNFSELSFLRKNSCGGRVGAVRIVHFQESTFNIAQVATELFAHVLCEEAKIMEQHHVPFSSFPVRAKRLAYACEEKMRNYALFVPELQVAVKN